MPRPRPVDEEGKEIDPGKDLESFLQRAAPMSEPEPEPTTPAWESVVFESDDPELNGKRGKEVATILAEKRKAADEATTRTKQLEEELANNRRQQETEAITRRVLAEQQAKPETPAEPAVDPRYDQRNALWMEGRYDEWQAINDEIQRDERRRDIAQAKTETEQQVFARLSQDDAQKRSRWAHTTAMQDLQASGVPPEHIYDVNRITAVYSTITRKPTQGAPNPYFDAGGPMNPNVIKQAWADMFGMPQTVATPAPVAAAPVAQTPRVTSAAIAPPPGSNRPAPAAAASRATASNLNQQDKKEIDHLASTFGLDAEKLAARRRARAAAERDAHV